MTKHKNSRFQRRCRFCGKITKGNSLDCKYHKKIRSHFNAYAIKKEARKHKDYIKELASQ